MQLIRLSLAALGPFAGEHTIDLAELGASGLFLLEGPTGAGKSTLIDAVVFALYGKVASAGASEERLRSNHAGPGTESYVELVFETGSGLYKVRRTPSYPRPKQRGSGTTMQQATVKLWRLSTPDAPGELLSTRLDEAGLELQTIVGLDRTQFVQTVVLPQGEFAAFLRSDPEQRRGLLQKVFGTEIYERVQERLERMRAQAARAVTEAEQVVAREVARFVGAAGVEDTELSEATIADVGPLAQGVADRLAAQAARAADTAVAARGGADRAAVERDRRAALVELVGRRGVLRAEAADLAAQAEQVADRRRRWQAAADAERCWPVVEAAGLSSRARTVAGGVLDEARAAASADLRAVVGAADAEVALKALAGEIERCATARGALARAMQLEAELPDRREGLASRAEALATARLSLERSRVELAALPGRRAALAATLADARREAEALDDARVALRAAQATHAAVVEAAEVATGLRAAEAVARSAAESTRSANQALAAAHEARIVGIAGELAAGLEPGVPCLVCGSTEHPAPAEPGAPPADLDELEAARAAADAALRAAMTEVEVLRRRRADLGEPVEDPAELPRCEAAVAAALHAQERAVSLATDLEQADAHLAAERAALESRERDLVADETRAEAERAALDADEAEVLAAADGAPSVRAKDDEYRRRNAQARSWAEALRALQDCEAAAARDERERDRVLADAGLDLDEVLRVRLPAAEVAALHASIEAHAARVARVTGALADLPPDLPDSIEQIDPDSAARAAAETEALAVGASREAAVLERRAQAAGSALACVRDAVRAAEAARADAEPVTRMANVAAASGGEGSLTLATYVLGQRFADLVAAANARLGQISDGRYELARSTEKEAVRTRRLGLALKVLDHRTGIARDPRTLSGGETFYVALCLALGLADVVTAEAGGVELGTLLIDEGFGSLDAETLDAVLGELGRLRDGGRTVGVVSHVDTLKQAIAERIEVRPLPDGSSTLTVRC